MKKQLNSVATSFSILTYIRTTRLNKQGKASIYLRITVNGRRAEFSVKRKIEPKNWSSEKNRVKGSNPKNQALNHYIDELESKAYDIHSKLVTKRKPFTAELIKNKILNKKEAYKSLLIIYNDHNTQIKELVGLDYSYGAYRRHIRTQEHLAAFIKKEYKRNDIFVKEVDLKFITQFDHYLKIKKIGCQNTTTKYVTNLKKIMRLAFANNWVNKDPFYHWKAKWKKVERDVLTELELRSMIKKKLPILRLEQVRDLFVFCCFTGLAYVDVEKLSQSHIVLGADGERWIKIKRSKTDTQSSIPLLPVAEKILAKYSEYAKNSIEEKLLPVISNQKINTFLKEIALLCGIKKKITFHISRHTFATTVTLANGIPIESVSKMLGHNSLKTTQIYAKVIDRKLRTDMEVLKDKFVFE